MAREVQQDESHHELICAGKADSYGDGGKAPEGHRKDGQSLIHA
jgi:hypothetical protein